TLGNPFLKYSSLCSSCPRAQLFTLLARACASSGQPENSHTVNTLRSLSVDVSKIRKTKGWVLSRSPVYVREVAALLWDAGADESVVAWVLQTHLEAVLCTPELLEAQRELWMSVCASPRDLVGITEKFPASFFTADGHLEHQRANVAFFRDLGLHRCVVAKLMASAPQSFSDPVKKNQEMVRTFQKAYLELGGDEVNMRVWLQKVLSQNPHVLLKPLEIVRNNMTFLQQQGFARSEVLQLLSKLKGFVTEVQPKTVGLTLDCAWDTLGFTAASLRQLVLKCPSLLFFSVAVLAERFRSFLSAGNSLQQITETPAVLDLTPQILQYRVQKLTSCGYDIRTGSLEPFTGNKDERPRFNPVAPPRTDE
uniref:Mitochondrial transcription termination factor 2 n=1 Tax=Electrophorus electricus TaxID=8005 RepID=A0AAY5EC18_ELEEL